MFLQSLSQQPDDTATALGAALDLWYGPAGDDLPNTLPLRSWAATLTERKLLAREDLAEAYLALGGHTRLVAGLRRHVHENPLRERPVELLMRALDATGDRTAALAEYRQFRSRVADELGVQPSPRLQHVHHAFLSGTAALDPRSLPAASVL